jgi:hypothetical protein
LQWRAILRGTAATAIHNIQQLEGPFYEAGKNYGPLTLEEDPLAYPGILVDILEEWGEANYFFFR